MMTHHIILAPVSLNINCAEIRCFNIVFVLIKMALAKDYLFYANVCSEQICYNLTNDMCWLGILLGNEEMTIS